jgi:hypothetical protein
MDFRRGGDMGEIGSDARSIDDIEQSELDESSPKNEIDRDVQFDCRPTAVTRGFAFRRRASG